MCGLFFVLFMYRIHTRKKVCVLYATKKHGLHIHTHVYGPGWCFKCRALVGLRLTVPMNTFDDK
jgi:hypothetical protein